MVPMGRRDDEQLVAACLGGDEQAWAELVDRYASLILSIPRRYGFPAAAAEDVFADVCLTLVRSLKNLREARALPGWLVRTTTRATWEAARKAKRELPADLPELTGGAPAEEFVSALEDEQLVREALAQLSEICRELLTWLYFTDPVPGYDDIAKRMGKPRGSLGPTRRRCLDRMRTFLEPRLGGVSSGPERPPMR